MFNKTTINAEQKVLHVSKETIVEKSITPDKVTDMYDKVREEMANAFRVESNDLKGIVVEVNHPTRQLLTKFLINGKPYIHTYPLDDAIVVTPDLMFEKLREGYALEISREIIRKPATFTKLR